jgi:hypothetical protein
MPSRNGRQVQGFRRKLVRPDSDPPRMRGVLDPVPTIELAMPSRRMARILTLILNEALLRREFHRFGRALAFVGQSLVDQALFFRPLLLRVLLA